MRNSQKMYCPEDDTLVHTALQLAIKVTDQRMLLQVILEASSHTFLQHSLHGYSHNEHASFSVLKAGTCWTVAHKSSCLYMYMSMVL